MLDAHLSACVNSFEMFNSTSTNFHHTEGNGLFPSPCMYNVAKGLVSLTADYMRHFGGKSNIAEHSVSEVCTTLREMLLSHRKDRYWGRFASLRHFPVAGTKHECGKQPHPE